MEARLMRAALLTAVLLVAMGARQQSANFIVDTADPKLAAQIAQTAEQYRHDLAVEWLGQTMPNWAQPCVMTVQIGPHLGAGGATTFVFDHGEVFGWRMTIQGSAERVLDSVLPHEVTHMVYASYFRRPLPRWADEGGATSVECASEKTKHRTMLVQFLRTGRGIAFGQMFQMTEYPRDVMPLYAQAYALSEYLIQHGGRRKYVQFLSDGMKDGDWTTAVQTHYGFSDLSGLQNTWVSWIAQGFPEPKAPANAVAAIAVPVTPTSAEAQAGESRRPRPEPNLLYRTRDKETIAAGGKAAAPPISAASEAAATMGRTAATASRPHGEPQVLPATGWRSLGTPGSGGLDMAPPPPAAIAPSADSGPTEVTRPQTMEPSRQIILEWNQP
jgi:hypothetical protein